MRVLGKRWKCSDGSNALFQVFSPSLSSFLFSQAETYACLPWSWGFGEVGPPCFLQPTSCGDDGEDCRSTLKSVTTFFAITPSPGRFFFSSESARIRSSPTPCNVVLQRGDVGPRALQGSHSCFKFWTFGSFPLCRCAPPQRQASLMINGTFPALLLPLQKVRRFCRAPSGTDRRPHPLGRGPKDLTMLVDCGVFYMSTRGDVRRVRTFSLTGPFHPFGGRL